MNKKILSVLICAILISIVSIPAMGIEISFEENISNIKENYFHPNSGCLEGVIPTKVADFKIVVEQPEIKSVSYSNDLISLVEQLDEDMYLGYLEDLVDFGPRVTGTVACDDAGDYIYNLFDGMGLDAEYFYWEDDSLYGNNIIGTLEGEDPTSDEIYIICGHYDSVPGSPGADDNGAGTVAVISAANLLRNAEFDHTIKFVTFSGEEQGLYGSYYYAKEAAENGDNIKAVLNLDMIGYTETPDDGKKLRIFDDEDESVWITEFIDSIAVEYYDNFNLEIIPSGWSWGSDHYYFWEFGYHAIFGHEYKFNSYYHSPQDTIENMDLDYAVRSTQLMIVSLAELSGFITYNAPYIPEIPTGPSNGIIEEEYNYTTFTTDPQGDLIEYQFRWGDGTDSGWIGPYSSGDTAEAGHSWTNKKTYEVKVKAKDTNGYESDWSEPLHVTIPRNKNAQNVWYFRILERFPLLEKLFLIIAQKWQF